MHSCQNVSKDYQEWQYRGHNCRANYNTDKKRFRSNILSLIKHPWTLHARPRTDFLMMPPVIENPFIKYKYITRPDGLKSKLEMHIISEKNNQSIKNSYGYLSTHGLMSSFFSNGKLKKCQRSWISHELRKWGSMGYTLWKNYSKQVLSICFQTFKMTYT